nr:unnamed protein product [Digitaria exilis]
MAPAAAEEGKEEQGMEEADTVAPTAPERQQDAASTAGEIKKKIDEAIHSLGSWCSRCSEMLQAGGRAHVTGDFERRVS